MDCFVFLHGLNLLLFLQGTGDRSNIEGQRRCQKEQQIATHFGVPERGH